jgi:phosphoglucomutase
MRRALRNELIEVWQNDLFRVDFETIMHPTVEKPSISNISPLAGKPAPKEMLIDVARLERDYFERWPDLNDPNQMVSFGTSGHRGSSLDGTFTEAHILAITQAICDYRRVKSTDGPLYLGKDTHAVSDPAQRTALEVLAANDVETIIQPDNGVTPVPVISRAILAYNLGRQAHLADGIAVTPSHNPPKDGGFKYNSTNGGPADTDVTEWVQNRANELLRGKNAGVKRVPFKSAIAASTTHHQDYVMPYVRDLRNVVVMDAIRDAGLKLAVDPLGGASEPYWGPINAEYKLDIAVVNEKIDPTFSFMTVDHDGVIRMDCSSPYAMARLVGLKDNYRVAFGNDPDSDRHGIVTPSAGLMNPNHYLAVAIQYLLTHRSLWPERVVVGKTLVSSSMIDKVVKSLGRRLYEVPVGFKWFVSGLVDGSCCFGGEESAGASFLRHDGTVWTTDKDGLIMDLLAAEITARTGKDPGEHYKELTAQFGTPLYTRVDAPATPEQKAKLLELAPEAVTASTLAGEAIIAKLTRAPGDNAPIGGLKVVTASGWFAARPSGTENIYKIYAESFIDQSHLNAILSEAEQIVNNALSSSKIKA